MNILHVHDTDYSRGGGGQLAMYRLHHGLRRLGIGSKILCRNKQLTSADSVSIPPSSLPRLEYRLRQITSRLGLNDIHCLSTFKIKELREYEEADILNVHCIHGGFFNYLALPSLTRTKPAVFTLHDVWPFTGHCSLSYDCERWKTGCGRCPYPDAYPRIQRDSTHIEWKLKKWVYSRSNLSVVTLSSCRTQQARQSMLNRFPIHEIPNGIDIDAFQPLDTEHCRSILGIPKFKKVIMFAAQLLSIPNKGGDLLIKALQALPRTLKNELLLLTFGKGNESIADGTGVETVSLGYIESDRLKAIAYSAADLFVLPSRSESLPLVLQESMACGTPMVSFEVGGVPDIVRPGITGYLAEPENVKDLREGIVQLLEDEALRNQMAEQCRAIAVKEYPLELQVQRYIELYRGLLQN